ncbi:MAG: MFS transporter [Fervidobacterium sp.]|uniref:MFS transporter n=1 Tax=Fervidobacterium sp. TaxID=1871331 RepID=UPI00404A6781
MSTLLLVFIYVSFISLGLPDSMFGAAWPVIRNDMMLPVPTAGLISLIGTATIVFSTLLNPFVVKRLGTGKLIVISTLFSSVGLLLFSQSRTLIHLCVATAFTALSGGSIDVSLNNFVAIHYKPKHMNWLHSLWGIGTTLGAFIISAFVGSYGGWRNGYTVVSMFQLLLSFIFMLMLPVWNVHKDNNDRQIEQKRIVHTHLLVKSAILSVIAFFAYCAIETTTGVWTSSFLVNFIGLSPSFGARGTAFFFFGITLGRILSGFLSMKIKSIPMIRISLFTILIGLFMILARIPTVLYLISFGVIGFGCAPIFPTMMHETPRRFGIEASNFIVSLQMAGGYLGSAFGPFLFGFLISKTGIQFLPLFLLALLFILFFITERLNLKLRLLHE